MLKYRYLLVQQLSSGAYEVLMPGLFVTPDSEDTEVEALLDNVREREAGWWASEIDDETYQTHTFQAYTLLKPLSSFSGQTFFALSEQLGPLDDAFFAEKAIYCPPAMSLGSIGTMDGRIVVVLRVSGKRKRSETVFDRMKRSKLATTPPSIMAQPSNYENNQRIPSEKILDDRPEPDADIAPISLLYDGFGDFLDIFDGGTASGVAGLSEVNTLKLHQAVDEFAQKMCLLYNNEDGRRTAALPALNRIFSARTGTALYRAFAAASILQARIVDDAQKFLTVSLPPELDPDTRRFPSVTRLRQWPWGSESESSPGTEYQYISFQILGYYPDRQSYRLLYVAEPETTDPDPDDEQKVIFVKFVRQYSIELHAFCAERGFAPRILAFERLPGGWNAIAMEYIDSCDMITKSPELAAHRDRWTRKLLQLVQDFHAQGLVHGDLRDANIMCRDRNVMLINFDWGGKDGQVVYPTSNLNRELLEGRTSNDLRITKEDDIRILKNTLEKLTQ